MSKLSAGRRCEAAQLLLLYCYIVGAGCWTTALLSLFPRTTIKTLPLLSVKNQIQTPLSVSYISIVQSPLGHSWAFQTDFLTQYRWLRKGGLLTRSVYGNNSVFFVACLLQHFQTTNVGVDKSPVSFDKFSRVRQETTFKLRWPSIGWNVLNHFLQHIVH